MSKTPPPFVRLVRNGLVESIHRGHMVGSRADGSVEFSLGDPDFPTFLRSAAKPLQALHVVEDGLADRYGFTDSEVALMCGSVSGQDFHVAGVRSILGKVGLDESRLDCGVHRPSHRPTAKTMTEAGEPFRPIHNNCAGKHAAMLALCVANNWPVEGYIKLDHPVQKLMRKTVGELCGLASVLVGVGIDGCGVPVFSAPLKNVAWGYARLADPDGDPQMAPVRNSSIKRLMVATCTHPEMVAGDERVCTDVMRAAPNRFFAKTGAEASYGLSLFDKKLGVAFKIEDGALRALSPVVVETLAQLGELEDEQLATLENYRRPPIKNFRRDLVGFLEPVIDLSGVHG